MKKLLTKLCHQYKGLIRKYAHVTAVKCESADMENLLWELFIRAIKEYNTKGSVPFSGFVQSRIRYGQYNAFKKLRRQWQHESFIMNISTDGEDTAMTFEDILDPTVSAEDTVLAHENKTRITKAFHRLPKPQQALLYAYYVKGISLSELARQHGISRQAMQQHKNRALTALTVFFNE
ncbi:sigma-70 family RNA polymerase sigma factor [Veillonella intestinalis]|uniref:sigma-70 family RNA polymerase sigma factor n=1 Tax=Veillonella intestinalis TaxID=2941341 RepID=UPI002407D9EE|nr:sigma-70 family RNA polymerase sigma factor [Veillonella intestinalis]